MKESTNILSLLVGFNDADPVIGKLKMHFRYIRFRHVARDTILLSHRTSGGVACRRFSILRIRQVTRETLRVVKCWLSLSFFMRIVAGDTTQTRVCCIVLRTIEETVWLKTHCLNILLHGQDLFKSDMASAAKFLG